MFPVPPTKRSDDVASLAGMTFADPYRGLEIDSDEVRAWQRQQAAAAGHFVREWPYFERLGKAVARYPRSVSAALPRRGGDRWFRVESIEGAQPVVIVARDPFGDGQVVFDPATEGADEPPFVAWISPSPNGEVLALGICDDGSEQNTIRLVDVVSGELLPGAPEAKLMDGWTGGARWLPDSSGFFFTAMEGDAIDVVQHEWLHRLAPSASTVAVDVPWLDLADYRMVMPSRDGRYAVAVQRLMNPIPVAVGELTEEKIRWRPFVTGTDATVAGHIVDNEYIAVTNLGAPRGRLVAIALDCAQPGDPAQWREVVPESEAVLRTVTPIAGVLYLGELVETYSRIRVVDRAGREQEKVALPERAALPQSHPVIALAPSPSAEEYIFSASTLASSAGVYRHRPGKAEVEVLRAPRAMIEGAVIEDRWTSSSDGTLVPFHVVRRRDVSLDRAQPTMIFSYGGFNLPCEPVFPGPIAAFIEAGGVFVHAHLRGGGEFGLEWWEEGRLKKKQNTFADLYAIAEALIGSGATSPELLAVTGNSNGGLTAAVALTQRPDLWAAVVPRVPLTDLIRACGDGYGRMGIGFEFADPDDSDEVTRMAGFSPYQLVQDGVGYPAVFLDAGDTDPRCPPWHSRKLAARLQEATSARNPILLRVWENTGHGHATSPAIAAAQSTEWLAFVMRVLKMQPASVRSDHP